MIVHSRYRGVSDYNFKKNIVFFCLKIFSTFTNSVDPDEMQHYAAFNATAFHHSLHCLHYAAFRQGLHCLQKYSFRGFPNTKD